MFVFPHLSVIQIENQMFEDVVLLRNNQTAPENEYAVCFPLHAVSSNE